MERQFNCVATCRPGLEGVLLEEIRKQGGGSPLKRKRAVEFSVDTGGLYRMNMALRSAIQILVPLRTFVARDYQRLYYQCRKTNWHQYFTVEKTLRIDVNGHSPTLRNTQYVVHRIKDGIVDTFRKLSEGERPSIDKGEPDIHIVAHLDGDRVTLCLDSTGSPLFKRGYRTEHGEAPLKEDLAAGMLLLAGLEGRPGLVDPMCGSGTFLFEGWMILNEIAPNLQRTFAFEHWLDYEPDRHAVEKEALIKRERRGKELGCLGCEIDVDTAALANRILAEHFPGAKIRILSMPFQELKERHPDSLMIANPPYGVRVGNESELPELYRALGEAAKYVVPGGRLAFFTTNRKAARQVRLKAEPALTLFNGALEGLLYQYPIHPPPDPIKPDLE